MKRGYYVHNGDDDNAGFAVVATSGMEARKIVYDSGELLFGDTRWIDIRAWWVRDADVVDLHTGLIDDPLVGLLCGIYKYLEEYPCAGCGRDEDVRAYGGQALCEDCIRERALARGGAIES